ncbi:PDZ/DHR/GLGF domain protein [Paragonimus heterotremus]|uniref:PDZ/DHR/GLGF domain protein n=1 Tax=Paragonimus heterotremus TaxID=100268 RepID=A0A8J4SP95_9TREM|nr:PDZ/DHR/GLGF domain protein [Paragonimus heterotremus]
MPPVASLQEVNLRRSSLQDKFGLTLCYRNGKNPDDPCDVYVGEIEPNSVASNGANVMVGDRIIKINGELVRSRKQVIDLFQKSQHSANLLLARQPTKANVPFLQPCETSARGGDLDPIYSETITPPQNSDTPPCIAFKRPDQDSGMGRTTDDSARTEESSEQELESDQKSNAAVSAYEAQLYQTQLTSPFSDPMPFPLLLPPSLSGDVFANYQPTDPIDEELVHLGRLMQSLVVHCRQLVNAKIAYRSEARPLNQADFHEQPDISTKMASGHTRTTNPSSSLVSPSVNGNKDNTISNCSSCPMNRISADGTSVTPRMPRMGTRGMELPTIGTLHHPDPTLVQEQIHAENTTHVQSLDETSVIKSQKVTSVSCPSSQTPTGLPDLISYQRPSVVHGPYLEELQLQHTPSGQTSAYCTGESVKSGRESTSIGIRLWKPTPSCTVQGNTPNGGNGQEVRQPLSQWNEPIAVASLSDLGGSLLSLATTVSSTPNFFPAQNESMISSHFLADSLSPMSNWSIDGSSKSNQRLPKQMLHSLSITDLKPVQPLSTNGSHDGLLPPSSLDLEGSGMDRSRPSGISNISSSDSLSVTDSSFAVLSPPKHEQLVKPCIQRLLKKNRPPQVNSHGTTNHEINPKENMTNHATQRLQSISPNTATHTVYSQASGRADVGGEQASDFTSPRVKSQKISTAPNVHPTTSSFTGSQTTIPSVHPASCMSSPPFFSPQLIHNQASVQRRSQTPAFTRCGVPNPGPVTSRYGLSYPSGSGTGSPLLITNDQSAHPYECYDQFSSTRWTDKLPVQPSHAPRVQKDVDQYELPRVAVRTVQAINASVKIEETTTSDIYETPYASITLEDESESQRLGWQPNIDQQVNCHSSITSGNVDGADKVVISQNLTSTPKNCATAALPLFGCARSNESKLPASDFNTFSPLFTSSGQWNGTCPSLSCPLYQMPVYSLASQLQPTRTAAVHQFGVPALPVEYLTQNLNVMEWVVKKRSDGSRNRLLKERAKRVAEERSGLTTDDDAASEMKTGRHWTRTERRKQAGKSRIDRKKRQPPVASTNIKASATTDTQNKQNLGLINGLVTMTTV